MKKVMIGVIVVIVAAVVGCTIYEVASAKSTTISSVSSVNNSNSISNSTSSVSAASKTNAQESNDTASSTTKASNTISSSKTINTKDSSASVKAKVISKDTTSSSEGKSVAENSSTKVSQSAKKDETASSTSSSTQMQPSNISDTTQSSGTKVINSKDKNTIENNSNKIESDNSANSSNSNIINGQPVLFNNNSQVSAYYGTWTVGSKIGSPMVTDGAFGSNPSGKTLILTKSLYSFDGTVIENPNYYIISTNASSYFGSEGWTGNVGASNGIIRFIIAVPSNVRVTTSTIYKYETQSKIIINSGSIAVMNGEGSVYSASL